MKDLYRETGTIFRRSPLISPEGEGFASRVRAVIADHARQLQGTLARAKREGGRFTQGAAGKKLTRLPGGVVVETAINQFGLTPTLMVKVSYPEFGQITENYLLMDTGWLGGHATVSGWQIAIWDDLIEYYRTGLVKLYAGIEENSEKFQGTPPNIDENNQYISYNNDRDNYAWPGFPPSAYSGLTRLLAQSLMGAQRTDDIHSLDDLYQEIRNRMPVDFFPYSTLDPKQTCCIRAPNGDYWLLLMQDRRDAQTKEWQGKAIGVRLFPSYHFMSLNDQIHAGDLRDEDAARADAFVLGYCTLGVDPLDYVVFSDYTMPGFDEETDDFASLFSKTPGLVAWDINNNVIPLSPPETVESINTYAKILPWSWGWVCKWQMRGAPDEKEPGAVIILGKESIATSSAGGTSTFIGYVLRETILTFDFQDNRPSLVFTSKPWVCLPIQPHTLVYVGDEELIATDVLERSGHVHYLDVHTTEQNLTEEFSVYSWYDANAELNSLAFCIYPDRTTTYSTGSHNGYGGCPASGTIYITTDTDLVTGFFLVAPNRALSRGTVTRVYESWTIRYGSLDGEIANFTTNGHGIGGSGTPYVSSTPGVLWFIQEPAGPTSGWTQIYYPLNPEGDPIYTQSEPQPQLTLGSWHSRREQGDLMTYDPDGVDCLVYAQIDRTDYHLEDFSRNILSTGKDLIIGLTQAETERLAASVDEIYSSYPNPVPNIPLYARAAYLSDGYLYGNFHPDGLCTECIETRAGAWIGSA